MLDFRAASNVVLWLVAAVILHDLVLLPTYSVLDRLAQKTVRGAINYVRVPLGLSLLMLLVFWGTIREQGRGRVPARERARVRGLPGALAARQRGAVRGLGRALPAAHAQDLALVVPEDA